MDYSLRPSSSGSTLSSSDALPVSLRPQQPVAPQVSEPTALLDVLRQALAAGTRSADSILRAATDAARVLTGAQGTALALRTHGVIVCRARSGEIAPALGAPLNVDSGISGECLRAATILVCHDAANDPRVDPEVCRNLGVRSIVVVPLRGAMGMAGILEAFSTRAYAFGAEQIDSLRGLAAIVEEAYDREGRSQGPVRATASPAASRRAILAPPSDTELIPANFSDEYSPRRRYWIPGVVALALLLVSMVVWLSWREPVAEIAASESAAHSSSAPEESSDRPAPRVLPLKPNPGIAGRQLNPLSQRSVLHNAAEIEPATSVPPASDGATVSVTGLAETNPSEKMAPRSAPPSSAEPPPYVELTPSTKPGELDTLTPTSTEVPALGASVSTGVTDGNLIHKVNPTYPPEARIQRLAGAVTLDATIAEDGSVHEINVVSGAPVLAAAATAAVRQWRYSPSMLSGKPIEVQKRITIVFKLP